jgi:exodeoxyribonuclease VII large subunit
MQPSIPVLTVSQLTNAIKHSLESTFPHIWLQGEISNFKLQASGHLYFSLKDAYSQISAVMFRASAASLKVLPKDGAQVMVIGEINVYPPSGKYQIVVREMRLVGVGELLQKLEELKAKLHARGWFNPEHKKPLPRFPKCIGVVTSPTGAAIHDILNVLSKRFSGFRLLLNPVKVQGDGAALEIAQAIEFFNRYRLADVLIVGRGGGSIEDLWAFNEEVVAAAIYASHIPIISAVGHETDVCLSDFVADVRAPTPSAAAMMVIAEKEQQLQHLEQMRRRLSYSMQQTLRHNRQKLAGIMRQPMLLSPYGLMSSWMQRADDLRQQIDLAVKQSFHHHRRHLDALQRQLHLLQPTVRLKRYRERLVDLNKSLCSALSQRMNERRLAINLSSERLELSWQGRLKNYQQKLTVDAKRRQLDSACLRLIALKRERLKALASGLRSIDPKKLLERGYAILFKENEECAITSVKTIQPGQNLLLQLGDGKLLTTVNEVFES